MMNAIHGPEGLTKLQKPNQYTGHYERKLFGSWLGSRKRLVSKRSCLTFLALGSRLLEAINITQIKADTNAPTIKYAAIKIPAIVTSNPLYVCYSLHQGEPSRKTYSIIQYQYRTCYFENQT
jgi:hypothetical protein